MFHFPRFATLLRETIEDFSMRFPHSDISGSKVAWHLPEAYRRHAASFFAFLKPRHPPYALVESIFYPPDGGF
jgi:hypothetical protein